jgi:hypothetical protein
MLAENAVSLAAIGVDKWHRLGITGKSVNVMNMSNPYTADIPNKIIIPHPELNYVSKYEDLIRSTLKDPNVHDNASSKSFFEIAPDAAMHIWPVHNEELLRSEFVEYVQTNGISVAFRSYGLPASGYDEAVWSKLKNTFKLYNAIGNEGQESYSRSVEDVGVDASGAARFVRGQFTMAEYSSWSKYMDFCSITDLWVPSIVPGKKIQFGGTSDATPNLAACMALVDDRCNQLAYRVFSRRESYNFAKANCVDMYKPGWDEWSGWGVFVLPDPEGFNPFDWFLHDEIITLQIGNETFTVNGIVKPIDAAPIWNPSQTRVLMPVRIPIEAMGGRVEWDEAALTITVYIDGHKIILKIGVPTMWYDGEEIALDQAPIQDPATQRSYIPVRAFAQITGRKVAFDPASLTVKLEKE